MPAMPNPPPPRCGVALSQVGQGDTSPPPCRTGGEDMPASTGYPTGRAAEPWLPRPALLLALVAAILASPRSAPAETLRLFNGRNLDGWTSWLVDSRHADPRGVFRVVEGQIRISGDGLGYLATTTIHSNYSLTVEWRWGSVNTPWGDRVGKARDSGLFLHATGPHGNSHDGNGAFMAAVECNIFQGATGDILLIRGSDTDGSLIAPRITADVARARDPEGWFTWKPGGDARTIERWGRLNWRRKSPDWQDLLDFRGTRDVERRTGEWNRLECEARGDRLRIRLNGIRVNEARDVWPREGRILLQCEGSEIFFRRVELKPL